MNGDSIEQCLRLMNAATLVNSLAATMKSPAPETARAIDQIGLAARAISKQCDIRIHQLMTAVVTATVQLGPPVAPLEFDVGKVGGAAKPRPIVFAVLVTECNMVKVDGKVLEGVTVTGVLASHGEWLYVELSDGQRVFCLKNGQEAQEPADCPVVELMVAAGDMPASKVTS